MNYISDVFTSESLADRLQRNKNKMPLGANYTIFISFYEENDIFSSRQNVSKYIIYELFPNKEKYFSIFLWKI